MSGQMFGAESPRRAQMCTASDLLGGPDCLRIAQWTWWPDGKDGHAVFLCNFHAEPFDILPSRL